MGAAGARPACPAPGPGELVVLTAEGVVRVRGLKADLVAAVVGDQNLEGMPRDAHGKVLLDFGPDHVRSHVQRTSPPRRRAREPEAVLRS